LRPDLTEVVTLDITYWHTVIQSLDLYLVQKGTEPNVAWTTVKTLFKDVNGVPCNGSYEVVVDQTWPTSQNGSQYALYISGTEHSGNGGYADLSGWFSIEQS
jgi:hypothetical protein